jgi:hypothetical protein
MIASSSWEPPKKEVRRCSEMEALEAVLGVTFPLSRSLYKRLEHDGYLVGWDAMALQLSGSSSPSHARGAGGGGGGGGASPLSVCTTSGSPRRGGWSAAVQPAATMMDMDDVAMSRLNTEGHGQQLQLGYGGQQQQQRQQRQQRQHRDKRVSLGSGLGSAKRHCALPAAATAAATATAGQDMDLESLPFRRMARHAHLAEIIASSLEATLGATDYDPGVAQFQQLDNMRLVHAASANVLHRKLLALQQGDKRGAAMACHG